MYKNGQGDSSALRGFFDDVLVSASVIISYGAVALSTPEPTVDLRDYKTLFFLLVNLLAFSATNRFFSGEKVNFQSAKPKVYPKILSTSVYFSLSLLSTHQSNLPASHNQTNFHSALLTLSHGSKLPQLSFYLDFLLNHFSCFYYYS